MGLARTPPPRPISSSPIKQYQPLQHQTESQSESTEPHQPTTLSTPKRIETIDPSTFIPIASSPPLPLPSSIQTNTKDKFKFNIKTNTSNATKPIKGTTSIPKPTIPPPTPNQPKRFVSKDFKDEDPFKKISKLQRSPPAITTNLQQNSQDDHPPDIQPLSPSAISKFETHSITHQIPESGPSHHHHVIKPSSIPVLIRPPSPKKHIHEPYLPNAFTSTLQDNGIRINSHRSDLAEHLHYPPHAEFPSPVKEPSSSPALLTQQTSGSTVGIYLNQQPTPDPSDHLKEELSKIQMESKLQRELLLDSQTKLIEQSKELLKEIEKRKSTEERLNRIESELKEKVQTIDELENLKLNSARKSLDDRTEISTDTVLMNGLNEKEKMMYEDRIHQLETQVNHLEYHKHQANINQDAQEHDARREAIWSRTGSNFESNSLSPENEQSRLAKVKTIEQQHDLAKADTVISDLQCKLKLSYVDQDLLRLRLEKQERDHRSILEKVERFRSDVNTQNQRLMSQLNELNIKDQEWARIGSEFEGLLEIERREKEELKQSIDRGNIEPKIELNSLRYEMTKVEQNYKLAESEVKRVEQKLNLAEVEVKRLNGDLLNSEIRIKSLEDELATSKVNVKELVTENESVRHAHQQLKETYELTLTELLESHLAVSEMEEQIGTLNRQLRISHRESREHSNSLQSIKRTEDSTKNESSKPLTESTEFKNKPLKQGTKKSNGELKVSKKSNSTATKRPTGRSKKPQIRSENKADAFPEVISDSEIEEKEIDYNRLITNEWISISGCITKPDQPPGNDENDEAEIESMDGTEKEPEDVPPPPPTKGARGRKKAVGVGPRAKATTKPTKARARKNVPDPIVITDHDDAANLGNISTPLSEGHSPLSEPHPEPSPGSPAALTKRPARKVRATKTVNKGKGKAQPEDEDVVENDAGLGKRNREEDDDDDDDDDIPVKKIKGLIKKQKEEEADEPVKKGAKKVRVNKKKVEQEEEEGDDLEGDVEEVKKGKVVSRGPTKNVKPRARAKAVKKKVVDEEVEKEEVVEGGEEEGEGDGDGAGIGNPTTKKRKIFNLKNHSRLTGGGNRILNWSGNHEDLDNDQNMLGLPPELSPVKKNGQSNDIGLMLLGRK